MQNEGYDFLLITLKVALNSTDLAVIEGISWDERESTQQVHVGYFIENLEQTKRALDVFKGR